MTSSDGRPSQLYIAGHCDHNTRRAWPLAIKPMTNSWIYCLRTRRCYLDSPRIISCDLKVCLVWFEFETAGLIVMKYDMNIALKVEGANFIQVTFFYLLKFVNTN